MPEDDTSILDNALGLDFAKKSDKQDSHPQEPSPDFSTVKKEKEKSYVNPECVKTGGPPMCMFSFIICIHIYITHMLSRTS